VSNFRFGLMVAVAFVLTFIGVWLGIKNGSVGAARIAAHGPASPAPIVSAPAVPAPDVRQAARDERADATPKPQAPVVVAKRPVAAKPVDAWANSGDRGRDRMRLTAIETANAYAGAPCDAAIKAAFVVAATTYIQAMIAKIAMPLDPRVREALQQAFAAGDVATDDFPANARPWIAAIMPQPREASPCATGRTAEHQPHQ
jgi:hypothetical protein